MDATNLATLIRTRAVSCHEVMDTFLDHIERYNPRVNAIVSLQDRPVLLKQADQRDKQLAEGQYLGWMHGLPHAVKDLARTQGIRTTFGSPLFKDFIPKQDEIFVERLKNAGAIIIGKTNTPEFGLGSHSYNPIFGVTGNAYDPSKTAGGSSGGAAAALALRMVPVADGSDMMGSLRNPAAFNNVLGFRPSYGRVPSGEVPEIFLTQLSCEGPMARTMTDLARLLSIQAGYDARHPLSIEQTPTQFTKPLKRDFKGSRIAWLGDFNGYLPTEKEVLPLCENSLPVFAELGCVVDKAQPDYDMERLWEVWLTHRHWIIAGELSDIYHDPIQRKLLKPEAQWEIEVGLKLTALQLYKAAVGRTAWYTALRKLFDCYDFLLMPTAQVFPFAIESNWPDTIEGIAMTSYHKWMEAVIGGTLSGCPVLNVPVGFNNQGLPMGIQIIGKNHDDFGVLQLGYAYEQATNWTKEHLPPLLLQ